MNRVIYIREKEICPKCNGKGTLDQYRHIADGQCFHCGGTGQVSGEQKQHIRTIAEMEQILSAKGILFDRWDAADADDWEASMFGQPTDEEIAFNAMREKMILAAYANA